MLYLIVRGGKCSHLIDDFDYTTYCGMATWMGDPDRRLKHTKLRVCKKCKISMDLKFIDKI